MKKIVLFWAVLAVGLSGCERDEIDTFDLTRQMVLFRTTSSAMTFSGVDDGGKVVVEIPFRVAGDVADAARQAAFVQTGDTVATISNDTVRALSADKWRVLEAVVPAGAFVGVLRIEITKPWAANDTLREDLFLRLLTTDGGAFYAGPENRQHTLTVSNKVQEPRTWGAMLAPQNTRSIGLFSPAYYAWIIEATGLTEFPVTEAIEGVNLDDDGVPQIWTSAQRMDFISNLKYLLYLRNEEAGSPLLHDEGDGKGQPVVVGQNIYIPLTAQ